MEVWFFFKKEAVFSLFSGFEGQINFGDKWLYKSEMYLKATNC